MHLIPFRIKLVVDNFGLLLLPCRQQKEEQGEREKLRRKEDNTVG